jgi:hypothetical protein
MMDWEVKTGIHSRIVTKARIPIDILLVLLTISLLLKKC